LESLDMIQLDMRAKTKFWFWVIASRVSLTMQSGDVSINNNHNTIIGSVDSHLKEKLLISDEVFNLTSIINKILNR